MAEWGWTERRWEVLILELLLRSWGAPLVCSPLVSIGSLTSDSDAWHGLRRRGGAGRAAQAYIKISESEIADDYPEPAQYEKARF